MSKESYVRGFCKAAEAAGVDPKALVKLMTKSAQNGITRNGPTDLRAKIDNIIKNRVAPIENGIFGAYAPKINFLPKSLQDAIDLKSAVLAVRGKFNGKSRQTLRTAHKFLDALGESASRAGSPAVADAIGHGVYATRNTLPAYR